jgi:hypothetical protein
MIKDEAGVWHLEDDSPHSVRCVEETPRAAFTVDNLEAILARIYLAQALARLQAEPEVDGHIYIDSYTKVWQGFLDDQVTRMHEVAAEHEVNGCQAN